MAADVIRPSANTEAKIVFMAVLHSSDYELKFTGNWVPG
jgi:hypothetical protein